MVCGWRCTARTTCLPTTLPPLLLSPSPNKVDVDVSDVFAKECCCCCCCCCCGECRAPPPPLLPLATAGRCRERCGASSKEASLWYPKDVFNVSSNRTDPDPAELAIFFIPQQLQARDRLTRTVCSARCWCSTGCCCCTDGSCARTYACVRCVCVRALRVYVGYSRYSVTFDVILF